MKGIVKAFSILVMLYAMFMVILEILRITTIIHRVKDAMNETVIYVLTENYDEIYASAKDGYTGAYRTKKKNSFLDDRDYANIEERMTELLRTEFSGEDYIKETEFMEQFKFHDMNIVLTNTGIRKQNNYYSIDMNLQLDLAFHIFNNEYPFTLNLHSSSKWRPKYTDRDYYKNM